MVLFLTLNDPGALVGKQKLLLAGQRAAEEVLNRDGVAYQAPDVQLCSLKVDQPLNLLVTYMTTQKATDQIQQHFM